MLLIGLSGKKGVGKNFVADRIGEHCNNVGLQIEKGAFAEPLKEFCIAVLGLPREACYGSDADKNALTKYEWEMMPAEFRGDKCGNMTIREVLQIIGTDFIRNCFDKEAWVGAMERRIKGSKADVFAVTDLRFPNESVLFDRLGGQVWLVDGPQRGDEERKNDGHESETAVEGIVPTKRIANGLDDDEDSIQGKVATAIGDKCHSCCCHKRSPLIMDTILVVLSIVLGFSAHAGGFLSLSILLWGTGFVLCCYNLWAMIKNRCAE